MNCSKLTHTCVFVLGNYNTHIFICIYFFSLIFHIHSDILVSVFSLASPSLVSDELRLKYPVLGRSRREINLNH